MPLKGWRRESAILKLAENGISVGGCWQRKQEEIRRELEELRPGAVAARMTGIGRAARVSEGREIQKFTVHRVLGQATEGALAQ